jgi:hypothetical protein
MTSDLEAHLAEARHELALAQEALCLADTGRDKAIAGARMDALEAYISDLLAGP